MTQRRMPDAPCTVRCRNPSVGRVSWPPDLKPTADQGSASAYVCANEQHQRDTAVWVYQITGHLGEFVPFDAPIEHAPRQMELS